MWLHAQNQQRGMQCAQVPHHMQVRAWAAVTARMQTSSMLLQTRVLAHMQTHACPPSTCIAACEDVHNLYAWQTHEGVQILSQDNMDVCHNVTSA